LSLSAGMAAWRAYDGRHEHRVSFLHRHGCRPSGGDFPQFWITLGSGLLVLILGILFLRKLAEANKLILGIVAVLVFATVGFTWIYERTEPTWATPAVSFLANFFPSKG